MQQLKGMWIILEGTRNTDHLKHIISVHPLPHRQMLQIEHVRDKIPYPVSQLWQCPWGGLKQA